MAEEFPRFLRDPDQASRESELRDYFGPNAGKFLNIYRGMRPGPDGKPAFRFFGGGFVWPAFFAGPVWFFYRKLWAVAWTITGLLVLTNLLSWLFPALPVMRLGLPLAIILAISGGRLYVSHAITKLSRMRAVRSPLDPSQVRLAGGVSVVAAWISGIIYGAVTLLGVLALVYLASHGVRLE